MKTFPKMVDGRRKASAVRSFSSPCTLVCREITRSGAFVPSELDLSRYCRYGELVFRGVYPSWVVRERFAGRDGMSSTRVLRLLEIADMLMHTIETTLWYTIRW